MEEQLEDISGTLSHRWPEILELEETLLLILSFLPAEYSLTQCSAVCTKWKSLVDNSIHQVTIRKNEREPDSAGLALICRAISRFPRLRHVALRGYTVTPLMIQSIIYTFPLLEKFQLWQCRFPDNTLFAIQPNYPYLAHSTSPSWSDRLLLPFTSIVNYFRKKKNAALLRWSTAGFGRARSRSPEQYLKELSFFSTRIDTDLLEEILQDPVFSRLESFTADWMPAQIKYFSPCLRKIYLGGPNASNIFNMIFSPEEVSAAAEAVASLTPYHNHLDNNNNNNSSNGSSNSILALSKIESITVEGSSGQVLPFLAYFSSARRFAHLDTLEIFEGNFLPEREIEMVRTVVSNCGALRRLTLRSRNGGDYNFTTGRGPRGEAITISEYNAEELHRQMMCFGSKTLRYLHLEAVRADIWGILTNCPALSELKLVSVQTFLPRYLSDPPSLPCLDSLESITFITNYEVHQVTLNALHTVLDVAVLCKNLRKLCLMTRPRSSDVEITDDHPLFLSIRQRLCRLKSLQLECLGKLARPRVESDSITSLSFSGSSVSVPMILCPRLMTLDLSGTSVGDKEISKILSNHALRRTLRVLTMEHCGKLCEPVFDLGGSSDQSSLCTLSLKQCFYLKRVTLRIPSRNQLRSLNLALCMDLKHIEFINDDDHDKHSPKSNNSNDNDNDNDDNSDHQLSWLKICMINLTSVPWNKDQLEQLMDKYNLNKDQIKHALLLKEPQAAVK